MSLRQNKEIIYNVTLSFQAVAFMQFFRHKTKQLRLVYFSLFAVLMLTFGPFTSQLLAAISAASQTPITQQQNDHQSHTEHHPTATQQQALTEPATKMPAHHNMSLCGYCDLLHTPVISANIFVVVQFFPIHQDVIHYHTRILFLSPYNYPLSQAPPAFS